MQDRYGREVTVTQIAADFTQDGQARWIYAIDGYEIELLAEDDAKAVELLEMHDAPAPAFDLAAARAAGIAAIDERIDALRSEVLGTRASEYEKAYQQAQSFAAGGYAGAVPSYVDAWLQARNAFGAGWTAQQATDNILMTGAGWLAAEGAMRALRLMRKEQVRASTDQSGIDAALDAVDAALSRLRAQLGV